MRLNLLFACLIACLSWFPVICMGQTQENVQSSELSKLVSDNDKSKSIESLEQSPEVSDPFSENENKTLNKLSFGEKLKRRRRDLTLAQKLDRNYDKKKALKNLAELYEKQNLLYSSIDSYRQVLAIALNESSVSSPYDVWRSFRKIYSLVKVVRKENNGETNTIREYSPKEAELLELKRLSAKVEVYYKNALTKAISLEQKKSLAEKIKDKKYGPLSDISSRHNILGRFYELLEQYDSAEQSYLKALAIHEKNGQTELGGEYSMDFDLSRLNNLYVKQGRYDKAEAAYLNALHRVEQVAGSSSIALIPRLKALFHFYKRLHSEHEKAALVCLRILSIQRKELSPQNLEIVDWLLHLGDCYLETWKANKSWIKDAAPRYKLAETYYLEALELELASNHSVSSYMALHNLYYNLQKDSEKLKALNKRISTP